MHASLLRSRTLLLTLLLCFSSACSAWSQERTAAPAPPGPAAQPSVPASREAGGASETAHPPALPSPEPPAVRQTVEPNTGAPSESPAPAAAPAAGRPVPVRLEERELFGIAVVTRRFSADERAEIIEQRLRRLADDASAPLESIHVENGARESRILAGTRLILTLGEEDAQAAGRSREVLASDYALVIQESIREYRQERSLQSILIGILLALAATVVLILFLVVSTRLFRRLIAALEAGRLPAPRFREVELLPADRLAEALRNLVHVLRTAGFLALVYFYLSVVFSLFPWTRRFSAVLLNYFLTPLRMAWSAFVLYLPNLFFIAVVILITFYLLRFIRFLFNTIESGTVTIAGFHREWADPTYKLVRLLVIALALTAAFPYIPGSSSPAFQGISVFVGVLLSLGSTSAVANMVGGIVLTYMRPFRVGDRVKIADTVGDVVEKSLLVTRVRTIKNVDVTIPNALVLASHIVNYSSSAAERGLILNTTVTIGYDVPWQQVHRLLMEAARDTTRVLADPPPFVLQTGLDDFYVSYELNAYTDEPGKMALIYSEMHQRIQDRFAEAGVEIMSPHYRAVRDGDASTIPEK